MRSPARFGHQLQRVQTKLAWNRHDGTAPQVVPVIHRLAAADRVDPATRLGLTWRLHERGSWRPEPRREHDMAHSNTAAAATTCARPVAKSLPRAYVATWAGLAGLAGAYLTLVGLREMDTPRPMVQQAAPTGKATQSLGEARLRQNLRDVQTDIGTLRTDLESAGKDQTVVARLTALEERMSLETGQSVAKSAAVATPPAPLPVPTAPTPAVADQAPVAAVTPPAPSAPAPAPAAVAAAPAVVADPPTIALAPQGLEQLVRPLETGSLASGAKGAASSPPAPPVQPAAPVAISFGPATVKSEPKPFGVQLSSGPTLDAIQLSWSLLSDQYPDALRRLEPRYTTSGTPEAGQTFDLMAGPIRSAADARKVCKTLAARGTDCRVAEFTGAAF